MNRADIDRQALDWLVRRANAPAPAEEAAFQAWLAANAAHRDAYRRWEADWHGLDMLPADAIAALRPAHSQPGRLRNGAVDGISHAASDHSDHADHVVDAEPPGRHRGATGGWRGALRRFAVPALSSHAPALLLAGFGVGLLAWNWWTQPLFEQRYATAPGQQRDIALPDGSHLRLDTATRIAVTLYRGRREVRLIEGQAQFEVERDAARPFDVLAEALRVTVVGTRFAVRYTPSAPGWPGVRVAVEQGRVKVAPAGWFSRESVELAAGQQVMGCDGCGTRNGGWSGGAGMLTAVSAVPAAGIAPWRRGRISFDNVPLAQALSEFARYGGRPAILQDPALGQLRITGTFDPHAQANFWRLLPQVLPVQVGTNDRDDDGNGAILIGARHAAP